MKILQTLPILCMLSTTRVSASSSAAGLSYDEPQCGLYMAPSSIEGAGLGLYTTKDLPKGSSIGFHYQDMYIPIEDEHKTLPFKGQHRFLSWLGYVWPEKLHSFYPTYEAAVQPTIPPGRFKYVDEGLNMATSLVYHNEDGEKISAFSPGIASLLNSHAQLANVDKAYMMERVEDDSPESSSYSPYYGVTFQTFRDITAGSELFLHYGEKWDEENEFDAKDDQFFSPFDDEKGKGHLTTEKEKRHDWDDRLPLVEAQRRFKRAQQRIERGGKGQPELSVEERARMLRRKLEGLPEEEEGPPEEMPPAPAKPSVASIEIDPVRGPAVVGLGKNGEEEIVEGDDYGDYDYFDFVNHDEDDNNDDDNVMVDFRDLSRSIKQVHWLETHGVCVDHLRWGRSSIPNGGRGAFSRHTIARGSIIAPAPLLALKRDDLDMRKVFNNVGGFRKFLEPEVIGQELLLNYAFGHPDSDLLLVPYSPVVNFINHNGKEPNAVIRWPDSKNGNPLMRDPNEWLNLHPLDVMDQSGRLMMEFVALRDLEPNEEIMIDYGKEWETAWNEYKSLKRTAAIVFRHEIGVPDGFFPQAWLNQATAYEVAEFEPLQPGEFVQLRWKHNNEPVAENVYAVGLPKGYTKYFQEYSQRLGITDIYKTLLLTDSRNLVLEDNEWYVNKTSEGEWFVHSFENKEWRFNMHYIAAWDETARRSMLRAMGEAGIGYALEAVGNHFGLQNLTCFHASFMGATECENSRRHADVYGTGGKGFNIIFPVILADGSKPELDIITQDPNVEISVKYKPDIAYVLSDWGYHKTSPNSYGDTNEFRVVAGTYCAQIDNENRDVIHHIYNGEINAPFRDQFQVPMAEAHWKKDGTGSFPEC